MKADHLVSELQCPYCGSAIEFAAGSKVYRREGYGFLYLCKSYPACDSYVSAGDDGRPTGTLANKYLRDERKRLYDLISDVSSHNRVPRQEVVSLIARLRGVKLFRINDMREQELSEIFRNQQAFIQSIENRLVPCQNADTQGLKQPLRYLFVDSHSRPATALPYESYRGHLKILNESVKRGLVNKITKHGTRKIFFVLTQAGKILIDFDPQTSRVTLPHRYS